MRIAVIAQTTGRANEAEQKRLRLPPTARVLRLMRVRYQDDRPLSYEQIVLPLVRFPALANEPPITSSISEIAQRYGLALGRVTEQARLVGAPKFVAEHLRVASGTQLLRLNRIVRTPDGQAVEWRVVFAIVAA